MVYLKRTIPIVILLMFFGASSTLQAELSSPDKKYIILVSVKYADSRKRNYYKHIVNQSSWKKQGKKKLRQLIKEKFGTDQFSHRIVRPNKCFIYYTRTNNQNEMKHYSTTWFEDIGVAEKDAVARRQRGYTVLEVGCNDGKPLDYAESILPLINESLVFSQDIRRILPTTEKRYNCPGPGGKSYSIMRTANGSYILQSTTAATLVDGTKLGTPGASEAMVNNFLNSMDRAYQSACAESEDAAFPGIVPLLKKSLLEYYQKEYKACMKLRKNNQKDCAYLLSRARYVGGVKG